MTRRARIAPHVTRAEAAARARLAAEPMQARLERAIPMMALVVVRHGAKYAPLLERLEAELEKLRRDDPVARARRILENYTNGGGTNAMRR